MRLVGCQMLKISSRTGIYSVISMLTKSTDCGIQLASKAARRW